MWMNIYRVEEEGKRVGLLLVFNLLVRDLASVKHEIWLTIRMDNCIGSALECDRGDHGHQVSDRDAAEYSRKDQHVLNPCIFTSSACLHTQNVAMR